MITHKKPFQTWEVLEAENQSDIDNLTREGGVFVIWNRQNNNIENVVPFWDGNSLDIWMKNNTEDTTILTTGYTAHKRMTTKVFLLTRLDCLYTGQEIRALATALSTGKKPTHNHRVLETVDHVLNVWSYVLDNHITSKEMMP